MIQISIFLTIVALIAIFYLFQYLESRLDRIENKIAEKEMTTKNNGVKNSLTDIERLNSIKSLSLALSLLNIFDTWNSLSSDDSVQLELLLKDFEKAENTRVSKINEVNKTEKKELQEYEEKHQNKKDFNPSRSLMSDILAASTAIVIRQTLYRQLEAVRELFFEVLAGKISIKEARKKSIKIASRQDVDKLKKYTTFS